MKIAHSIFAACLIAASFVGLPLLSEKPDTVVQEETEFVPVDDMHHFMEYISKPSYRELKTMMAEESIRRSTWRKVAQHSLILAETTILVAERTPEDATEEVAADWKSISLDTYKAAAALYKAAGEKDQEEAVKQYGLMMDACNACHAKYDPNDHQLAK